MLGSNGYLPPGRRLVTEDELHEHFVAAFVSSKNRQPLYEAWRSHRDDLGSIVKIRCQWIGGSFVSAKVDPGDIDVITLFDGPDFDALPPASRSLAEKLMNGQRTKLMYGIDAYPLAEYPDSHTQHDDYLHYRGYWDEWFGRIRGGARTERGYLEVAT